jgi:hypothetical protein
MWQAILGFATAVALAGWAILLFLPRRPLLLTVVLYLGVGILSLTYVIALVSVLTGAMDPGGAFANTVSFFTVEGLRAISTTDAGVVIGWIHYLAFDLFIGLWIARDADAKQFSRVIQAVVLLLVLLAGPAGLLLWLIVRERAARRAARR